MTMMMSLFISLQWAGICWGGLGCRSVSLCVLHFLLKNKEKKTTESDKLKKNKKKKNARQLQSRSPSPLSHYMRVV